LLVVSVMTVLLGEGVESVAPPDTTLKPESPVLAELPAVADLPPLASAATSAVVVSRMSRNRRDRRDRREALIGAPPAPTKKHCICTRKRARTGPHGSQSIPPA